jgi:hypothetical protein
MAITLEDIVNGTAKFDLTTPLGQWDELGHEYNNATDKPIWDMDLVTVDYARHHNGWNASPTPISGDTLARFKEAKRMKSLVAA